MRMYLVLIVSILLISCGDNPSTPPPPPADQPRQINITATFLPTSVQGSVVEAGLALDNGNVVTNTCANLAGCRPLSVTATANISTGTHQLDFVVVRHNFNFVPTSTTLQYGLSGSASVLRGGNVIQQISLNPQTVNLAPGGRFTYQITVNP